MYMRDLYWRAKRRAFMRGRLSGVRAYSVRSLARLYGVSTKVIRTDLANMPEVKWLTYRGKRYYSVTRPNIYVDHNGSNVIEYLD